MAIGGLLNGLRGLISAGIGALTRGTATSTIDNAVKVASDWLGPEARTITNKAGDKIFLSKDGLRRIRFDFLRLSPHVNPHMHVDEFVNGAWQTTRVYPLGVPPH